MRKFNRYVIAVTLLIIGLASLAPSASPPPNGNATRLRGRNISSTAPVDTQGLCWNNSTSSWTPGSCSGAAGPTGASYAATSTTSFTPATGSKTFATQSGLAYKAGARVRLSSAANPTTVYGEGVVTSYSGSSLVVTIDNFAGAGAHTDWNIDIAGDVGITGTAGPTGATGPGGGTQFTTNGIATCTGTNCSVPLTRTLGNGTGITITNPDGVAGAPSIAINSAVTATHAQQQRGDLNAVNSVTGNTSYAGCSVAGLDPAIVAYNAGMVVPLTVDTSTTTTATFNYCSLGALSVKKPDGTDPGTFMAAGKTYLLVTNGAATQWMIAGDGGGGGTPCITTALSLQYNNAGAFGCITAWTSDGVSLILNDQTDLANSALLGTRNGFGGGTSPILTVGAGVSNGSLADTVKLCGTSFFAGGCELLAPSLYAVGKFKAYNGYTVHGTGLPAIHEVEHLTAQTGAISTATLCTADASGGDTCGAGQYHVHWNFIETGTACGTPGSGGVTFLLTWTDTNSTAHSAVSLGMDDASAINAISQTFHFQTSLAAAWASGDFNFSTNGAIIQYATGYTACGVGTGTYQLDIALTQFQ